MKTLILQRQLHSQYSMPGSSLGHYLLFGQTLGTNVSCERIEKKIEDCVITQACARVKTQI